jgi:hypothetical protein
VNSALDLMDESEPIFEWYDAWILAAVVWATEGDDPVPLWRLISIADALNKAIVTRGELECGMGRLVSAGYISVAPAGFTAMPKALALKAAGPPVEIVSRAIGAREWSPRSELPQTDMAMYVSVDAYKQALKKYGKEFSKYERTRAK